MSPIALMELQAEALFTHDPAGRLLTVNEPNGAPAPRLFVGRTPAGNLWRFRHDLPPALTLDLERILAEEPASTDLQRPARTVPRLLAALAAHAPVERVWRGPAWQFPDELPQSDVPGVVAVTEPAVLRAAFPGVAADLRESQPCMAVLDGGHVAAVCFSSRNTSRAAEAGAETIARYRRRGYAAAVVAAWARAVRAQDRTPLYSTSWDNVASQGVARRLGLVLYGEDMHVT